MKEVFAPHLGKNVRLGGYRYNPIPGPHFRLARYLRAGLPAPPASCDYSKGTSISAALADVYGNNQLGDCVVAAIYHLRALWTGNATGTAYHATLDEIIAMYSLLGGYVKGDPSTDNGCDMTQALNTLCAKGFPDGNKPVGWVRVDGRNKAEVMAAIWLFEGCDFGVGLPDAWISPFPSATDFVWNAGTSNPDNGHSFMGTGYDSVKGVRIDTWGLCGWLTWEALAANAVASSGGEIDILLSPEMIAKATQKAPNGFDWSTIVADFDEIGGSVPVPTPTPPTPPPVTGPMTLAQAQALVAHGIESNGHWLFTKDAAIAAANAGLAAGWSPP